MVSTLDTPSFGWPVSNPVPVIFNTALNLRSRVYAAVSVRRTLTIVAAVISEPDPPRFVPVIAIALPAVVVPPKIAGKYDEYVPKGKAFVPNTMLAFPLATT
jgi:hypothetical protein